MVRRVLLPVMVMLLFGISSYAEALVLCMNPSGSVFASDQCKGGAIQINPSAVGLVGPAGPRGPAGPAGPIGPSNGFVGHNFSAGTPFVPVAMSTDVNAPTRILALALPAGSYVFNATVGLHAQIALGTLAPFVNVECAFYH